MISPTLRKKTEGFTIIEVVLVLAIAGLIFLIVFLALPQLQRSRRDTQRRGDAGKIVASLESYASNSGGVYPDTATQLDSFMAQYVTGKMSDPTTAVDYPYSFAYGDNTTLPASATPGTLTIRNNATCSGDTSVDGGASDRQVAVVMKLEEGRFCQDNQ